MFKDMTLGQYYPIDSPIHRLDARSKFVGTVIYIVSVFWVNNYIGYLIAIAALLAFVAISKVPIKFIVRGLKSIVVLMIFAGLFNLFLVQGEVVWSWWIFSITKEGIETAIKMVLRLALLIIGSSILTLTTTPTSLTDGLESLFKPLNVIKIPVHEIAMMMTIALRFIPILTEEMDKIMKAQMARGVDFEAKGLIKKAKNMIPLLVPLFISAFRRANDLAMAMEARCYRGGKGRTKMKPLKYHWNDAIAFLIMCGYLALCIIFGRGVLN